MSTATATKAFSGLAAAVGGGAALHGAYTDFNPHTISGMMLLLAASTFLILSRVRAWIGDNRAERERLRDEGDKLADQRTRYFAAQAALECERDRIRADLRASQIAAEQTLADERDAMQQEFDDKRAELTRSTFQTAVEMVQDGLLEPGETTGARVIPLPAPSEHRRAERRPV